MKILYFGQHFSTPAGSTGLRPYAMARRLVERGHAVTMVCGSFLAGETGLSGPFRNGVRSGIVDGIEVLQLDLEYSNVHSFWRRVATFLRYSGRSMWLALTRDVDLVFATSTPLTAGIPGIAAKLIRRRPFVFEVRDLWPELPRALGVIKSPVILTLMSWLEWCSYHAADSCVGLSPGIVNGIVARGLAADRVHMIPNGCDLDLFADSEAAQAWRPDGVDERDLLLVFAGTHGIANGLHSILDIAAELKRRQHPEIRFALIGEGKLKPELMARARAEGLDSCLFLPPVAKANLAGLLRGADLGMMVLANVPAFYYGTSPNKFFDYIACGLPVFNNYPGWLADMIRQHRCGIVVPPDDPQAAANALQAIAGDREKLPEMGENALKLARREFARSDLADRWARVLERTWETDGK